MHGRFERCRAGLGTGAEETALGSSASDLCPIHVSFLYQSRRSRLQWPMYTQLIKFLGYRQFKTHWSLMPNKIPEAQVLYKPTEHRLACTHTVSSHFTSNDVNSWTNDVAEKWSRKNDSPNSFFSQLWSMLPATSFNEKQPSLEGESALLRPFYLHFSKIKLKRH